MTPTRAPEGPTLRERLEAHSEPAAPELVAPIPQRKGWLRCLACGHECPIPPGKPGVCKVRFNEGGTLRVPFGYVATAAVDPVEKKPFYHVRPGSRALSFGMLGCDLHCAYCQNWFTSQTLRDGEAGGSLTETTPENLVEQARASRSEIVVSTYNEPLITTEWAAAVFRRAREAGLLTGYVSNGNANATVLDYLRPVTDLFKVDLKAFRDPTYRRLGAPLKNVISTLEGLKERGFWVEVVTLLVPGLNDGDEELRELTAFLAGLDPLLPWHVTAFHSDYRMSDTPSTPVESLLRAAEIGEAAGLRYVYAGNVPGGVGHWEDTRCHACRGTLVRRRGFRVLENRLGADAACPDCDAVIPGVWG